MSARKSKPAKRPKPDAQWRAYQRRKRAAEEFYKQDFAGIASHVQRIKNLVNSVLTDLASREELKDTVFEVAEIARENYCIGLMVSGADTAEEVTP